jgi:carbon storage regulator CsrA
MLVLSRSLNQVIRLTTPNGETIDITVLEMVSKHQRNAVKLGITAPKSFLITRPEKHEPLQTERSGKPSDLDNQHRTQPDLHPLLWQNQDDPDAISRRSDYRNEPEDQPPDQ